jgi:hypothetical protein
MLCLDNTDTLEGGASVASVVDYTIHGVTTGFKQLAAGQLSDTDPSVLYTAGAATSIVAITLVNTHTSAVTVNLYIDPANGGSPRRLIPKDLTLGIGYSAVFDGQRLTLTDTTGATVTSALPIHTHESAGEGGQLDHGDALVGLTDDDHTQYIRHNLSTVASDFLVGSGSNTFIKKTLAETGAILEADLDHGNIQGLTDDDHTQYALDAGTSVAENFVGFTNTDGRTLKDSGSKAADFAVAANGVTNGDSHDHAGGDGAQIDHGGLGGLSDADHVAASVSFTASDKLLGRSTAGAGAGEEIACTSAGRALLDDANATAQRTTLGLGSLATQSATFVDRGDPSGFDLTLGSMTTDGNWHDWDLSSIVPAGATAVLISARITDDAAGSLFQLRENGNSNVYNTSVISTQVANIGFFMDMITACDTNRIVEYTAENLTWTAINLTVRGWWV